MTREELLEMAKRRRSEALIDVLLGSYHIAYVELMFALNQLSVANTRAITTLDQTASCSASPAVDGLQALVSAVTAKAARLDEILNNLAITLERLGEDVRW